MAFQSMEYAVTGKEPYFFAAQLYHIAVNKKEENFCQAFYAFISILYTVEDWTSN